MIRFRVCASAGESFRFDLYNGDAGETAYEDQDYGPRH